MEPFCDAYQPIVYARNTLLALRMTTGGSHQVNELLAFIPKELVRSARRQWGKRAGSLPPTHRGQLTAPRRKRGRRGGIRRRLRLRKFRPALPAIILANLRSIQNKMDELRTYARYSFEFREAALLCFSETWLHAAAPDSLFDIDGFSLIRADRNDSSGKSRGGGVCAYINERWCRQYSIKHAICNSDFELLAIGLRPFYLPREFGCILLFVVYVPPSSKAYRAAAGIAECVCNLQQQFPEAPAIVLGDLNTCNLEKALPGFHQVVKCKTRKENTLDKCYTNISDAYQSRSKPPIANSDHNVVHLIPTYQTKLKSNKPQEKLIRLWTQNNKDALGACFDCTNWEVLREGDLDSACTVTTDYINFCVESIIPTKTVMVFPNNKTYITKDIKHLMNQRKLAFKNKDIQELRKRDKELRGKIRTAKDAHKRHLEELFKANNPRKMWNTMKNMAGVPSKQHKSLVTNDELASAVELNTFFTRFEATGTAESCEDVLRSVTVQPEDRVEISVEQVASAFRHLNARKSTGPDNITASILKTYGEELAPVWQPIFQHSLDTHTIPTTWKTSHIIPVPKKTCPKECNDFRPIALTSILMKSLEKIICPLLSQSVQDKLDPSQFAYRCGRNTEDAVATLTHLVSKHLDTPKCKPYARVLFIDFSSAFNTIKPDLLLSKMHHLEINPHLIHWYHSFLINRQQLVRVNNTYSPLVTTSSGAPQGCVSSPLLFTIFTNDCTINAPNHHLIKFSDDTALVALMTEGEQLDPYYESVNKIVQWCDDNTLILNPTKTEEVIFGTTQLTPAPVIIHNKPIKQSTSFKYLGVYVDSALSWSQHVDYICKKVQQRIYFLRRLRSFGASKDILHLFFSSTIQSILQYGGPVWLCGLSVQLKARVLKLLSICSKLVGHSVENFFFNSSTKHTVRLAEKIALDPSHVLHEEYQLLPSGRRFRVPSCRRNTYKHSFLPHSISLLNQQRGGRK